MPEHRLIRDHRDALRADLPARIAEEVADGLAQTYDHYLEQGLSADNAAPDAVPGLMPCLARGRLIP